jgi:hypothetical protein
MSRKHLVGSARRPLGVSLMIGILLLAMPTSLIHAWPAGVDHSIFDLDTEPDTSQVRLGLGPLATDEEDGSGSTSSGKAKKIVGVSLLGSGIFLCSWGITSWEVREYQCCPANNTANVIKIVAGILLLNAGLIYILEAQ